MKTKTVYQYDIAGMYVGPTEADESPLEPGVFLIPARCVEVSPPEYSGDQWPRWNGATWKLVAITSVTDNAEIDPVEKLRSFLVENPDVAELINR